MDQIKAKDLNHERRSLEKVVSKLSSIELDLDNTQELIELASSENDDVVMGEIALELERIEEKISKTEFRKMFSNESDPLNCFVDFQAGAGGTEACDWAMMLRRQYIRYAERKGFSVELLEESPGEVVGIKSCTLKVKGDYAYGYFRTESGVHRLVRKSPFDSAGVRHTSFASVYVYPIYDTEIEITIDMNEVRVDTYRASGAGGQHINKTDSAVRLTHGPTGIVVQCQNERSQHKNKETAMKMLKARLYQVEKEKEQAKMDQMASSKTEIGWGNQIRSYVFHPYTMVKDHRTKHETGNIQAVMNGEIDGFIKAYLLNQMGKESS